MQTLDLRSRADKLRDDYQSGVELSDDDIGWLIDIVVTFQNLLNFMGEDSEN